ncbi:PLP-dependent aminotransferase family protein [Oscillatoria sp. CS-180]|uniref:aminotransferase-like domain-containing protein n=1 Tax=Oscillatoria sp. CS-180 TaxID=3021720 RepID=UPI00232E2D0F|nr:PLP-dependent aminotransferase family protein [Oscillatoria sp. CS-180]MDB9528201.1 PLP-dependent aminotransferase family protein [Oscillatoria sp. CS-180]
MNISPIELEKDQVLYEQVAERLQALITEGTLQPGHRLPSVRKLREQLSVSTSTVLEAYRVLEDRGLITVRPQSGYYVRQTVSTLLKEPSPTAPPLHVHDVDIIFDFQVTSTLQDEDRIPLGAAFPVMELLPLAQLNRLMGKVLRENPEKAHAYGGPIGCEELRVELAKRMLNCGCSITPDQLMITNGANEAMYLALQALTKPGDVVAVESPTYFTFLEAMKTLQLKALTLPTHPREGVSLPHLEEALKTGRVKAVLLVSNFSNPVGCCMDDVKKKKLVELLNQYDAVLIEDDVYGELYFEGTRPKAIKAFDTGDRVIYYSSLSKTLSPGLRIGWCAGGPYQPAISKLKSVINLGTAIAPQLTVSTFLSNGGFDRHLRQLRRAYQSQMARMQQAISDYFPAETRITRPSGGHVLWIEMPDGFDVLKLYRDASQYRISIAPGVMFSASGKCYGNCFRINTAVPWSETIDKAVETLGYLAKKQLAEQLLDAADRHL